MKNGTNMNGMTTSNKWSRLALGALAATACTMVGAEARTAGWPTNVTSVAVKENSSASARGDLSKGAKMELAWANTSQVACFPATENANFQGNHVLYGSSLPARSELTIKVIPTNKTVDVSLYAIQLGTTNFATPPGLSSGICEAGYDQVSDNNPGVTETVKVVSTTNPYNVLIGVAGPKGVTAGSYKLELTLKTASTVTSAALTATVLTAVTGGLIEATGDLATGGVVALEWAANSSVACFPATENVNFNGNHVIYSTGIPSNTDMTITATPSDSKTDLSVYAYEVSTTDATSIPPNVGSCVSCQAGYDAKKDSNPGVAESVKLNAIKNPYNVFIGVAGANGTKTGKYTLKVELKPRS
ncbi:MAG: hypothetical protein EXR75_08030 [Myxococcales bacterium]|nr:hypothetical protein [Myxococcales bacterium]